MAALSVFEPARRHPSGVALIVDGQRLSFRELAARVEPVIAALAAAAPRGALALVAEPTLPTLLVMHAALAAGRALLPLHPRWTPAERRAALAAAEAGGLTPTLVDPPTLLGTAAPPAVWARPEPGALAACLFTSGSSGRPRGVLLERRAFQASARAALENLPMSGADRWLLAMPLAHVGGLSILTRSLAAGSAVLVHPRFDADRVLADVHAEGVTLLSVVPTMLRELLARDAGGALARLRAVLVGGAPLAPALRREARARGVPVLATYGLTEACSQVATERPGYAAAAGASVGPPLPGVELAVRRADGTPAPPGEPGRLLVRGELLFRGYLGGPARERGAWLDTGDVGALGADGALTVLGRADGTVITGGENVHPSEVEACLDGAPGIAAAAVVGVPDARWGEALAAVVVLEVGATSSAGAEELVRRATVDLAPFKRPRRVVVVPTLPLLPGGKVDRRAARALALGATAVSRVA